MSRLNTAADRPYSVSLATRIASSSPLTRTIGVDRAEGLLAVDAHLRRHVVEHRRVDDRRRCACRRRRRRAPLATASSISASMRSAAARLTSEPSTTCPARIAARQRRRPCAASFATNSSAIFSSTIDPLGRHADLALVHEGAEDRGVHRVVDVGVVEHDAAAPCRRARAAPASGARRGSSAMMLADRGRAGEVDAPHRRMRDQRLDHLGGILRRVGDDVDDARREAGLVQHLDDQPVRAPGRSRRPCRTTVLPQASGMAMARTPRMTGAFHGAMPSTTPAGWRTRHATACRACRTGITSPRDLRRHRRRLAQHAGGEMHVEAGPGPVAPVSRSSPWRTRRCAPRARRRPSGAGRAARSDRSPTRRERRGAASTALAASASLAAAASLATSPVTGSLRSKVAPDAARPQPRR